MKHDETIHLKDLIKKPVKENTQKLYNHFYRYSKAIEALNISKNDVVIDASCGEGYGSYLLSLHAKKVWSLDINKDYLKKAEVFYKTDNLNFHTYDEYDKFNSGILRFVVNKLVCIETIEHIKREEQEPFILKLLGYLAEGGDMFVTVPLGENQPSSYNKFHLNEPSIGVLHAIFSVFFDKMTFEVDTFVNSYGQKTEYCMITLKGKKEWKKSTL